MQFLNSSFMSASLSALAGAGLGVWGAQRLAERSTLVRELLEGLRQANAVVALATTIANQAMSLKVQNVKPLTDKFFADKASAELVNAKLLARLPSEPITFQVELTKISPLTVPVTALTNLIFSAQLMPGKALALVSMVEQSVTDLTHATAIRTDMIDRFHSDPPPLDIYCQDYYGLKRQDGNTNAMYHDSMVAIAQYTDDIAFFSGELADELQLHAKQLRIKLAKLRRDVPKASAVDFSEARTSGIMPPREKYADWLSGFITEKDG